MPKKNGTKQKKSMAALPLEVDAVEIHNKFGELEDSYEYEEPDMGFGGQVQAAAMGVSKVLPRPTQRLKP